jgi:F0F1-type ATP synthase membrane subunit c/vacuolar-type H+-ATPase subunit K
MSIHPSQDQEMGWAGVVMGWGWDGGNAPSIQRQRQRQRENKRREETKQDFLTTGAAASLCAIMAQIISIYGLVVAVIISNALAEKMALHTGFVQLGAGLAVGLCGLAAGFAIGIVGDSGGEWKRHPTKQKDNYLIRRTRLCAECAACAT